jgi:transcriptional regulator of NAD metabolism
MKNAKFVMAKPVYISFRTTEETREILEKLAKEGYRSLSQQCDMIILEWLKQKGHLKQKSKK